MFSTSDGPDRGRGSMKSRSPVAQSIDGGWAGRRSTIAMSAIAIAATIGAFGLASRFDSELPPEQSEVRTSPVYEAYGMPTISEYAHEYGLDLDQAARELALLPGAIGYTQEIMAASAESLVSVDFRHEPNLSLVVALTTKVAADKLARRYESGPIPVRFITGDLLDGRTVAQALAELTPVWSNRYPEFRGSESAAPGRIVILIKGSSQLAASITFDIIERGDLAGIAVTTNLVGGTIGG